jgi:hypothetical protein
MRGPKSEHKVLIFFLMYIVHCTVFTYFQTKKIYFKKLKYILQDQLQILSSRQDDRRRKHKNLQKHFPRRQGKVLTI